TLGPGNIGTAAKITRCDGQSFLRGQPPCRLGARPETCGGSESYLRCCCQPANRARVVTTSEEPCFQSRVRFPAPPLAPSLPPWLWRPQCRLRPPKSSRSCNSRSSSDPPAAPSSSRPRPLFPTGPVTTGSSSSRGGGPIWIPAPRF